MKGNVDVNENVIQAFNHQEFPWNMLYFGKKQVLLGVWSSLILIHPQSAWMKEIILEILCVQRYLIFCSHFFLNLSRFLNYDEVLVFFL